MAKTLQLYRQADSELRAGRRRNHSGSAWVRHIPSAFILAWLVVLGASAAIAYPQGPEFVAPLVVMAIATLVITVTEAIGWSASIRSDHPWQP